MEPQSFSRSSRLVITTSIAARRLNRSERWLRTLCARHGIGKLINPRLRLLSETDLRRLRRIVAHNSRKSSHGGDVP
jgi:hypothetical protein